MIAPKNAITTTLRFLAFFVLAGSAGALVSAVVLRFSGETITADATVFLALVTAVLAIYTALLAKESRETRLLADRHHQESQNPLLTLQSILASHKVRFNAREIGYKPTANDPQSHTLSANVMLLNVGYGPALRTQYRAKFSAEGADYHFPSEDADDWATLGTLGISNTFSADPVVSYGDEINGAVDSFSTRVDFEITVRYYSVFGGQGTLTVTYDEQGNYSSNEAQPTPVTRRLGMLGQRND